MDVCCGGRKDDEESAMLRCLVAERRRRSWNSEHKPHEFHSLLSSSWTVYCCEIGGCLFNSSWCCILMLGLKYVAEELWLTLTQHTTQILTR
ncbi:hypothetical protein C4D60_Mb08t07540 [Musa balbisiana]|uniref:Uncharacterized protein n=1 Tax=Musa balbisiana TaxID=52838 RepID=A0A4S8K243_MUSBA|nr:hypothetical protein C4D60_Mb08t07540 [Musa balbisiana]